LGGVLSVCGAIFSLSQKGCGANCPRVRDPLYLDEEGRTQSTSGLFYANRATATVELRTTGRNSSLEVYESGFEPESLTNQGRFVMAITQKDRDDFLRRMGAVTEARQVSSGDNKRKEAGERVWTDDEIEEAISYGF
jgi:hypothetical protein